MIGKVLFLESVAGIAGDMFTASFVDAGLVSVEALQALLALLGLPGVVVEVSRPLRATMRTTHVEVKWTHEEWKRVFQPDEHAVAGSQSHSHSHSHHHHHGHDATGDAAAHWHTRYLALDAFLAASALAAPVKEFARRVFRLIAEAEADAHGMAVDDIAFHEVGTVDSILDVVMAAHCITTIAPDRVYATPLKLGRGTVAMAHGTLPVPAPAVARLVVGMPIDDMPAVVTRPNVELTTPTGAAILKALAPTFVTAVPAGTVKAQGMGSGTMDLGVYPNVFRIMLLEAAGVSQLPYESDRVVEITCNVDDETPERTAWIAEQLLAIGALDVWLTPITGKKGRAGVRLSLLAEAAAWEALADWLLRHGSTFGLRHRTWDRLKLARRFDTRQAADGTSLSVKVGMTTAGEVLKQKVEYDDVRKVWNTDPDFRP